MSKTNGNMSDDKRQDQDQLPKPVFIVSRYNGRERKHKPQVGYTNDGMGRKSTRK